MNTKIAQTRNESKYYINAFSRVRAYLSALDDELPSENHTTWRHDY